MDKKVILPNFMKNLRPILFLSSLYTRCFDLFDGISKYRFVICYRPPGYSKFAQAYATDLAHCLQVLASVTYTVFVCGDLNQL